MNTIDHGKWIAYVPAPVPEGMPPHALFARRESDGVDWYDYVHPGTNFNADTVKIAAWYRDATSQYIVGPATYDATAIFPQSCIVHEVTDYAGSDPQADLGSKAFDPATGEFTDPIMPPQTRMPDDSVMQALASIQNRLDALENK